MKKLPTIFRSDNFDFRQLAREGDVALFRKTKQYPSLLLETFEVVIVRKMDDHIGPRGEMISAGEHMPRSEQWGTHGWSLQTLDRAWEKFRALRDERVSVAV